MRRTQIGIFYPADPVGPISGRIDTVIRVVVKHAPPNLGHTLFGASSDLAARPVGFSYLNAR